MAKIVQNITVELISVFDEYSREPAANYDVESLILEMPRVEVSVFPDDHLYFEVHMKHIL